MLFKVSLVLGGPEEVLAAPRGAILSLAFATGLGFLYCEGKIDCTRLSHCACPRRVGTGPQNRADHCGTVPRVAAQCRVSPALCIADLGAQRSFC